MLVPIKYVPNARKGTTNNKLKRNENKIRNILILRNNLMLSVIDIPFKSVDSSIASTLLP